MPYKCVLEAPCIPYGAWEGKRKGMRIERKIIKIAFIRVISPKPLRPESMNVIIYFGEHSSHGFPTHKDLAARHCCTGEPHLRFMNFGDLLRDIPEQLKTLLVSSWTSSLTAGLSKRGLFPFQIFGDFSRDLNEWSVDFYINSRVAR